MAGILNWTLAGLKDFRDVGHFTPSESSRHLIEHWLGQANPVEGFIQEHLIIDPKGTAPVKEIHDRYKDHLNVEGANHRYQRTRSSLIKGICSKGHGIQEVRKDHGTKRVIKGVTLKPIVHTSLKGEFELLGYEGSDDE